MADAITLNRQQLASFLNNNHLLVVALENLFRSVEQTIPTNIEDIEQLIQLISNQIAAIQNPDARLRQIEMLLSQLIPLASKASDFDRRIRQLELLASMELA